MDKQSNNNINEIKLLVLQLAQQFNKKFDEQARVIVDQRDRLNSQQDQIHNQRAIIDELAWQIRDLRDSVRKCSEQISNAVHSRYYDDIDTFSIINNGGPVAENGRLKLIIPETNAARQSNHRAEFSPIYESINFDAAAAAAFATTIANAISTNNSNKTSNITTTTNEKNTQPTEPVVLNPLQRQNAFDSTDGGGSTDRVVKRKQNNDERDVRDFLERCIPPPPPVTSPLPPPPHPLHDTDSDDTEPDLDDPVQISHRTLMKLNSLYSVYKMRRSDISEIETDEAATTEAVVETTNETTDDVVLRLHNKFDKSKSRLFRGSSKAMCSFVSNVEDDYLPRLNGSKNDDEHDDCDGNDNGFANSTATVNEIIGNDSNDAHCLQHQQEQEQQKPIYTQNDELYI